MPARAVHNSIKTVSLVPRFLLLTSPYQHGNFNPAVNVYESGGQGSTHPHVAKGVKIWKSELPYFEVESREFRLPSLYPPSLREYECRPRLPIRTR